MHAAAPQIHHLAHFILITPEWRALCIDLTASLLLRLAVRRSIQLAASLAVLLAATVFVLPSNPLWPTTSLARIPGALLVLSLSALAARHTTRTVRWLLVFGGAALTAWWLRGAPLDGARIASATPVFLGLLAATSVVRRLAASDTGWAGIAASTALAIALWLSGGPAYWAYASVLPAVAGIAFLGRPEAAAALAQATTLIAVAMIVALDRGRLTPIDLATLAPLVVWTAAPHLLPRLNRAGPALAASLAAVASIAVIWATTRLLWPR